MKNVKTIFAALMACVIAFAFTSCEKDGVYTPKKKLSRIYCQEDGGSKVLLETWNWDKGVVTSIVFNDDDYTMNFSYNGKQLQQCVAGEDVITFTYDGKQLSQMEMTSDGEWAATYTFKHDGSRISEIDAQINSYLMKGKVAQMITAAFRLVSPELAQTQTLTNEICAESPFKGTYTYTDIYEYDGKNVIALKRNDSNNNEYTYSYTYSDYLNPFYHMLPSSEDVVGFGLSKNAVSSYHYSDDVISSRVIDLTVTFPEVDGKYPLHETRTEATTHTVGGLTNIYTSVDDYFFEYE